MKKTLKSLGILLLVLLLVVVGYVAYVFISYYRLDDNLVLDIDDKSSISMPSDKVFTAVTYNVGFGAYSPEFTFFMDGGKESVAKDADEVYKNINGSINTLKNIEADFMLIQEIDTNSTRSYHVNQLDMFKNEFSDFSSTYAQNYDSPFLMYPILQPHGKSMSGIGTFSKYKIESSVRRSLPISESFSKLLDLDRCFSVNEIKIENGKSLFIYNVHMSAYGGTPEIRSNQIKTLFDDMQSKYNEGHYVICGGDYNHCMPQNSIQSNNDQTNESGWAQPFPHNEVSDNFLFAENYKDASIPTCRDCDIPYIKGETNIYTLDGFFTSDNIEVIDIENKDEMFMFSDHNPVVLTFKLR